MKNILLDKIWKEASKAQVAVYYADMYIDKQIRNSKIYNSLVTCFSAGGALLTPISYYFPVVATFVVGIMSIANQVSPIFFKKNEDLTKTYSLRIAYDKYFNNLLSLFDSLYTDKVTEKKAQKEYNELYESHTNTRAEMSRQLGTINQRIERKAQEQSDSYLNSIYNS